MKVTHQTILKLAIPMTLSYLSVALIGVVDIAVLGHLPDSIYIAGCALGTTLLNAIFMILSFLRMTASAYTAQCRGARNWTGLSAFFSQGALIALVASLLILLLSLPIRTLYLMPVEDLALSEVADTYIRWRIWSVPFVLFEHLVFGTLLGLGYSGKVLKVTLLGNLLNVIGDIAFVFGLHWNIEGVALASVLSDACMTILAVRLLLKTGYLSWPTMDLKRTIARLRYFFGHNTDFLVRSCCLQGVLVSFGMLSAQQGDLVLAANTILLNIFWVAALSFDGFSYSAEVLVGRFIGAKRPQLIHSALYKSALWVTLLILLNGGLLWIFRHQWLGLVSTQAEVKRVALQYWHWLIILLPAVGYAFWIDGVFAGALRTREMRNSMIVSLIVFSLFWLCLPEAWDNRMLWRSLLLFFVARSILLSVAWSRYSLTKPI